MAAPGKTIKIGKYDVIDTIGRGGMGVVYLAKDPHLDRRVAIKMMNVDVHESGDFMERFYREARATASLQHPNIVTVYELGEHQGRPFLAMEYVEGNSLEALLRAHHPLSLLEKLSIVIEVCQGLSYAHQRTPSIIHRDVKPANIMVLKDGGVKIVDFGIARLGDHTMTRTGQIVGSLYYMSPEQIRDKGIDARADIYATGVVLYQLLTYALPFEGESTASTLAKIITEEAPPFRQYGISCPPELEAITLKALSKDREQRFPTAEAFALSLGEVQAQLKQDSLREYLEKADLLRKSKELLQAQELLLKALKIDRQNTTAARMLSAIRGELQAELSAQRAQLLKQQAEEALGRDDYDSAMALIQQAIELENTPDVQTLRGAIEKAKSDAELVRKAIARAEAAQRSGDLDAAKNAIDTAFSRRPNDSNIKALRRAIERDLEERERQRKLEDLLDAARKQMAERKFTSALDLLREAQKLDPSAPQLRVLLDRLASEHQQEKRRKRLEQLKREVQEAIDRDDYNAASTKAAEGLQDFPDEPTLSQLKELADGQIEVAELKAFVRQQTAKVQEHFDAGHTLKALECVELALERAPGNARLESLRLMLLDRLAKDRDEADKSTCLRQANEAMGIGRLGDAIQVLEAARLRFTDSSDLDKLLRFARDQQAKAKRQAFVDQHLRNAQLLLEQHRFDEAVELLQEGLQQEPSEDLELLLGQAKAQQKSFTEDVQAAIAKGEAMLKDGAVAEAREFLSSRPASYRASADFVELLRESQKTALAPRSVAGAATQMFSGAVGTTNRATVAQSKTRVYEVDHRGTTTPSDEPVEDVAPPPTLEPVSEGLPPKSKLPVVGIGVAVLVVVLGIIAWWLMGPSKAGTLIVQTHPNAQVFLDDKFVGTAANGTLTIDELPAGRHAIRTELNRFENGSAEAVLKSGQQQTISVEMRDKPQIERHKIEDKNPPATGKLELHTNVDNAEVYVDGKIKGLTERGGGLELSLEPGKYKLQVKKSGYKDSAEERIQIAADKTATENLKLDVSEKPALPAQDAYLSIKAPTGAQIRVDNGAPERVGTGRLVVKVQPGNHDISAQLDGYSLWSGREAVSAGANKQVDISLTELPLPAVALFNTNIDTIDEGQSVKLSWSTRDANSVSISPDIGQVEAAGERTVSLMKNTTYTLTAKGPGGEAAAKISVTVRMKAPTATFNADATSIEAGQSTTLKWSTQNATEVSISGLGPLHDLNGSHSVTPTENTTYTLTAKGGGGTAQKDVIITVKAAKPVEAAPRIDTGNDVEGIIAAQNRYREAMESGVLEKIKNAGPAFTKKQLDEIIRTYEHMGRVQIQDDCSGSPQISGDVASWTCDETMTNVINMKPVTEKHRILFKFQKQNGSWRVFSHRAE